MLLENLIFRGKLWNAGACLCSGSAAGDASVGAGIVLAIGRLIIGRLYQFSLVSVCHLNSHHPARRLGTDTLAALFITFTYSGPFRPPSSFSCAIAKHRKIESSYLLTFSRHSLRTFWLNKITGSGQVKSPKAVC